MGQKVGPARMAAIDGVSMTDNELFKGDTASIIIASTSPSTNQPNNFHLVAPH